MFIVKSIFYLIIFFFFLQKINGQDRIFQPKITVKWAPTGLILGDLSLQGEYGFIKKSSLTAKIGVPFSRPYHANFDGHDVDMHMRAFSFLAGYRKYLSKQILKGFYIEPFFTYAHHTTDGTGEGSLDNQRVTMDFSNDYNGAGFGVQLGSQFIIAKRLVIDLFFFGPQLTSSRNDFRAIDPYNYAAWTTIQADEAEQDIRNFLNQFPFIRNKVDVHVDKINRTVMADFKGALVGVRFGVSIGIAL
ncbi:MAG: DUF3575 domain-containing protein [Bacteroidetes bacterium]|nr:MAG: DUF3575 domain-containing protein [Bacteroidota bacterium]